MLYEYKIDNLEVVESIAVNIWGKEIFELRRWRIHILTSDIDYRYNRDSINRCRKWLLNNHLELFI